MTRLNASLSVPQELAGGEIAPLFRAKCNCTPIVLESTPAHRPVVNQHHVQTNASQEHIVRQQQSTWGGPYPLCRAKSSRRQTTSPLLFFASSPLPRRTGGLPSVHYDCGSTLSTLGSGAQTSRNTEWIANEQGKSQTLGSSTGILRTIDRLAPDAVAPIQPRSFLLKLRT